MLHFSSIEINNHITYELFHLNLNFWFHRFSLEDTKYLLVLCFSIPASLWIFSCSCLFGCSKTLRVEESGQMRIRCRRQVDDLESPYRRASDSSKDFSGNNIGQKFKYKKNGEKISWKLFFNFFMDFKIIQIIWFTKCTNVLRNVLLDKIHPDKWRKTEFFLQK